MKREVQISCIAYGPNGVTKHHGTVEQMSFFGLVREVWKFWKNWNTGFDDYDDMKISFNSLHRNVSKDER